MIPTSSYLSNIPNQAIYDHQIWNHMEKCYLMIPISSHLNNLPNQTINKIVWLLYLKSHQKMLFHDTYIILFDQLTKSSNKWGHVIIIFEIASKMLPDDTYIVLFDQLVKLGNKWDHVVIISEIVEKCCLIIPILSNLSNLPNQAINEVIISIVLKNAAWWYLYHPIWPTYQIW